MVIASDLSQYARKRAAVTITPTTSDAMSAMDMSYSNTLPEYAYNPETGQRILIKKPTTAKIPDLTNNKKSAYQSPQSSAS